MKQGDPLWPVSKLQQSVILAIYTSIITILSLKITIEISFGAVPQLLLSFTSQMASIVLWTHILQQNNLPNFNVLFQKRSTESYFIILIILIINLVHGELLEHFMHSMQLIALILIFSTRKMLKNIAKDSTNTYLNNKIQATFLCLTTIHASSFLFPGSSPLTLTTLCHSILPRATIHLCLLLSLEFAAHLSSQKKACSSAQTSTDVAAESLRKKQIQEVFEVVKAIKTQADKSNGAKDTLTCEQQPVKNDKV